MKSTKISPVFYELTKKAELSTRKAERWYHIHRRADGINKKIAKLYIEKYDEESVKYYIDAARLLKEDKR